MAEQRFHLHVHKLTRHELLKEGFGREVFRLLNATYKDLYGFAQLSDRKVDQLVDQYIKIADMNLICTVVDGNENNKMVGFGITFPSLSAAMKKTHNGRLFPLGWWHLIDAIKWHHADTVDMLLIQLSGATIPALWLQMGASHAADGNEYPCAEQLAVFRFAYQQTTPLLQKRPITL